nr:Transposon TX1 149 kDa protein [Ipomoea batatas]
MFVDYNTIRSGRIILVWNSNKVACTVVNVFPQCIHCVLHCKVSNKKFFCSVIYGLYTVVERRDLWQNLYAIHQTINIPWITCGDFNIVKGPGEKVSGVTPTTYFTKEFVECCNTLNLSDAPCVGNFFTWTNGKVKAKLDRVMVDTFWSDDNYSCWVEFKDFEWMSDHCPTVIKLFGSREAVNRPFKFFNMWLTHPSFHQILDDAWKVVISGTKQYEFVQHLKGLKSPLKRLNREEFGHISEKAKLANEEFSQFVQSFDVLTASGEDRQKMQILRKKACFYAEAERQFFCQKLKLKKLIDGDKGTKFFHGLVKKSNRDRSITCILNQFGQPTTSLVEIGEQFVNFYKDLLGTARPRSTCRLDYLNNGAHISLSQQTLLTCEITSKEIKDALFYVDDQRAPGPDVCLSAYVISAQPVQSFSRSFFLFRLSFELLLDSGFPGEQPNFLLTTRDKKEMANG